MFEAGNSNRASTIMMSRILSTLRLRNQRRHERFNIDLPLIILKTRAYPQGIRYQAADWSKGGFRLERCGESVRAGDSLRGDIQFLSGPRGSFVARVVRADSAGSIGAEFTDLVPEEFLFPVRD